MTEISEGRLVFCFDENITASKYDQWGFYLKKMQNGCSKNKAIDILAIQNNDENNNTANYAWLIEIKDFRTIAGIPRAVCDPSEPPLEEKIAQKVRDSLAGLVLAGSKAIDLNEKSLAKEFLECLQCDQIKIILHIEQDQGVSYSYDLADLKQKLRCLLRAVDPNPMITNMNEMGSLPWSVHENTNP